MNHAFRVDDNNDFADREIHSNTPGPRSGKRHVFPDRPGAIDMIRIATDYVDGMSPQPNDDDRAIAHLAWMAFIAAQSARTKIGRICALRELADAICLIKDARFRGQLIDAQCVELADEHFFDYEETVLASPAIAEMFEVNQLNSTKTIVELDKKCPTTNAREMLLLSAKPKKLFRIGTMVAASIAICCTFLALREFRKTAQVTVDHVTSRATEGPRTAPADVEPKKQNEERRKLFEQSRLPSTMIVDVDPLEDQRETAPAEVDQHPGRELSPLSQFSDLEFTWFTKDALHRKSEPVSDDVKVRFINSSLRTEQDDSVTPINSEQEALAQLRAAEASIGPDSQKLTRCLGTLASIYFLRRDYAKAEPVYQRQLKMLQSTPSATSAEVMHCSDEVAQCLLGMNKLDDAIELFEKVLAYYEEQCGVDDYRTIDCVDHLAKAHLANRNLMAAVPLFERVLRKDESTHRGATAEVADHLDNLALAQLGLKDYRVAKELFERAQAMRRSVTWAGNPILAISENHLGVLYAAQRDYQNAKLHFEKCQVLLHETLDEDHVVTALVYDNLAKTHLALGDTERALRFWKSGLRILRETCGPVHPDTLAIMGNIRKVEEKLEKVGGVD